ncbi:MAG: DUF488 domain-containing protein [Planctomycetes bacterium]|nr:DUF488 domain-containing protein [Planctomycetota bacterium]
MLTRQKILLELLRNVGHPLSRTVFVKMTFLLRHETVLAEERTFYDFVPYKYGPFSFALYRELDGLRKHGYVSPDERTISLLSPTRNQPGLGAKSLPSKVYSAVEDVVAAYGNMRERPLLKSVYSRYPWYAIKSEKHDLLPDNVPECPAAQTSIYTAGYEGKSVDRFFNDLLRVGIREVVDVRSNPASRKYGFSKKSLRSIGEKLSLEYHHVPELGIPSDERQALDDDDAYERLLSRYERHVIPKQLDHVRELATRMTEKPSVLVCMEAEVSRCHRGRLANALADVTGLPVVHL